MHSPRKKKFKLDKDAVKRIENEFDDIDEDYSNYDMPQHEEEIPHPKKHKRLKKFIFRLVLLCIIVLIINVIILLSTGQLWFNEPKKRDYPVRGPIITEELGEITWSKFAAQNIQMSYIRATKSTTYEDKNFAVNWSGAKENNLTSGALHIFDMNMDGKEQAQHFIDVVGDDLSGRLFPAVEVKLSLLEKIIPPDYDKVSKRLEDFVNELKSHYGVSPVIFTNSKVYEKLVAQNEKLSECPLWYESLYSKPDDNVNWTFWGYSNKIKFAYYESGGYLDMVLFSSGEDEFKKLIM